MLKDLFVPMQSINSPCDCDGNVLDECGVCGGEGIAEGACDCDGNVLDECGVCGGEGIAEGECDCDGNVLDECGVCGGPGLSGYVGQPYVYAMGFEDWNAFDDVVGDDGETPDDYYPSFYRYDYNADGTISNPELMFRINEFDADLSDDYYPIAYDRNPATGVDYFLIGDEPRTILTYDIELDEVVNTEVEFEEYIADLTFGADGTCYAWIGQNIKTLDLTAGTVSQFASASGQANGGKGLTYDYDNDRLLLASGGHGDGTDYTIGAISLATGTWELLHTIAPTPSNTEGEGNYAVLQGLEFIGNDMCLVSGSWWHYGFGQLDMVSGDLTWTTNPLDVNPAQPMLKDLFVPTPINAPCDCEGNVLDVCGVCGGEGGTTWYADVDGDGKGDCEEVLVSCEQPEGYVLECGDACPEDPSKYDPGFCGCGMVEFFAHGEVVCAEICCPDGDCPGPEDLCGFGTVWDPECQQCICTGPTCYGDINLDGVIQLGDLLDLLGVYGTSCDDE